jgi:hypothetical protein
MRAFLREIGCADALVRSDLDAEISDMKVRKRNDTAFARIAMAVEDVVSDELVKRSTSDVYPDGDASNPERIAIRIRTCSR